MWRNLIVTLPLCLAHDQIPGEHEQASLASPVCNGDEEHALLQVLAQPRAKKAASSVPSVLLDKVRNLAQDLKSQSPETIIGLVASIKAEIEEMLPSLVAERDVDQHDLDAQFAEINACADHSDHGTGAVDELANQVAALESCAAARSAAATARDDSCGAFGDHARTTYEDFPTALGSSATQTEILAKMRAWQRFLDQTLSGMESRNTACDDATAAYGEEDARCLEVESEYDGAFCNHQVKCAMLHGCHNHETAMYTDLLARREMAEISRKDQFRTLSQVGCLCDLIPEAVRTNTTISEANLNNCAEDVAVDHLDLLKPTPDSLSPCPPPDPEDPECPVFEMPPLWSNGEASDAPDVALGCAATMDGGGWTLVRHIPPGHGWAPSRDQLHGTDSYGDADGGPLSAAHWSVPFADMEFNQFLFATGDCEKWLIARKDSVDGHYSNARRQVLMSSDSALPYEARWYNRRGAGQDPHITLGDYSDLDFIYSGEGGWYAEPAVSEHNGINVFVRLKIED